jgi:hypothetical protein
MAEKTLETIFGILFSFALVALPILWIVELVLSARWHKKYFAAGMPIFVFRIPVQARHTNVPSRVLLENNFKSSGYIRNSSLLFEELDSNTMGFRESLLQFGRWYSVMHGLLVFDVQNSRVIVKGFLDWTITYFSLLWIIGGPLFWLLGFMGLRDQPIEIVAFGYSIIFIILGIFCSLDYFRFSQVAKFAAQVWSQQHVATVGGV